MSEERCACCEKPVMKVWHGSDGSATPLCEHHWPKGRQKEHLPDPWPPGATTQAPRSRLAYRWPTTKA
jgi:hypothetical protein